jgi:hypothetical protein
MLKGVDRRLRALEGGQRATKGAEFDRLMALARTGQLDTTDLARLSDEQLWWLVAQEPIALPPDEQLERKLREVTSEQG